MNNQKTDIFSIWHFIFGVIITLYLLDHRITIFVTILLFIFFELMEHLIVGDLIFDWNKKNNREIPKNALYDIIFGLLGVFIGFILFV